jgi:alpha-beta hydrolase superfamily lysophospholipase
MTKLLHTETSDGLRLPGFLSQADSDVGLLLIHGMGGCFVENPYAQVLAEELPKAGINFLYGHNRGYSSINDIRTTTRDKGGFRTFKRTGRAYERFTECVHDITAWVQEVRKASWQKIYIAGYSLGGPKLVYSLPQLTGDDIKGIALLSAADMVGLGKKDPNYTKLLTDAQNNLKAGQPRKLLEGQFWGEDVLLSSQTFLDLFEENGPADVLPLYRKPVNIPALAAMTKPLLILFGELDDVAIDDIPSDLANFVRQVKNAQKITTKIIAGAPHSYENHEQELAQTLVNWIQQSA